MRHTWSICASKAFVPARQQVMPLISTPSTTEEEQEEGRLRSATTCCRLLIRKHSLCSLWLMAEYPTPTCEHMSVVYLCSLCWRYHIQYTQVVSANKRCVSSLWACDGSLVAACLQSSCLRRHDYLIKASSVCDLLPLSKTGTRPVGQFPPTLHVAILL